MKRRKSVFAPARELSLDELLPAMSDGGGGKKIEIADWSALPEAQLLQREMKDALEAAFLTVNGKCNALVKKRSIRHTTIFCKIVHGHAA